MRFYRSKKHTGFRALVLESLESRRLLALDPTASEQELMQLSNRLRTDPTNEFSRLIATVSPRRAFDANVDFSLSFFNSNVAIVQGEMSALTAVPPLAWNETAQQVALDYLPKMAAAKSSSHTLDGTFQQRIGRYPFDFSRGGAARENTFINAFSPVHAHAAYVIDWGAGPNGLQASGHRGNLMDASVNVAGMGFLAVPYESQIGFGPSINAEVLIGLGGAAPVVTGAVFQDRNASSWYDAGEGLGGVQISLRGPAGQYTVSTMSAGGYNAQVPAGTYVATASGGGMRFPISIPNVVVSAKNVWLNFIYDPSTVPQDGLESNNSPATATPLTGLDQTIGAGTIHRADIDYFRLPASTSGNLRVDLQFPNSQGNLNLRLLDAAANTLVLANSTTADRETINIDIIAGRTYYVVVESPNSGVGGPYSLTIDAPPAQTPAGRSDSATTATGEASLTINVLANDSDPDGSLSSAQLSIGTAGRGTVEAIAVGGTSALRYTPAAGYTGIDRFTYIITDQQGLTSAPIAVEVMVLNFATAQPFHNGSLALDVNGDGLITAIDALLVINQLNLRRTGVLPTTAAAARDLFGYVDCNGNGTLEPLDALLVINQLNGG